MAATDEGLMGQGKRMCCALSPQMLRCCLQVITTDFPYTIGYLMRFVAIGLLLSLLVGCGPGIPSQSGFERLEAQGDLIVEQIENYRTENGVYPDDLSSAAIAVPDAPYGGWRYHLFEGGEVFQLSIGDYGRHMFTLYWISHSDSWSRDT